MAIAIRCSGCHKNYRVKDELAGRQVKCPGCSSAIQIPALPTNARRLRRSPPRNRRVPPPSNGGGNRQTRGAFDTGGCLANTRGDGEPGRLRRQAGWGLARSSIGKRGKGTSATDFRVGNYSMKTNRAMWTGEYGDCPVNRQAARESYFAAKQKNPGRKSPI